MIPSNDLDWLFRDAEKAACIRYQKDIIERKPKEHNPFSIGGETIDRETNKPWKIWEEDKQKEEENLLKTHQETAIESYRQTKSYQTATLISLIITTIAVTILVSASPLMGHILFTAIAITAATSGVVFIASLIVMLYRSHSIGNHTKKLAIQHVLKAQKYIDERQEEIIEEGEQRVSREEVFRYFKKYSAETAIAKLRAASKRSK